MNYKINASLIGTFGYSMAATLSEKSVGNIRENLIAVGLGRHFKIVSCIQNITDYLISRSMTPDPRFFRKFGAPQGDGASDVRIGAKRRVHRRDRRCRSRQDDHSRPYAGEPGFPGLCDGQDRQFASGRRRHAARRGGRLRSPVRQPRQSVPAVPDRRLSCARTIGRESARCC